MSINNFITKDYGVYKMKIYKEVCSSLPENVLLEMEVMQLMKLTENIKITQSEIIEKELMYSLDIFEAELNEFGRIGYKSDNYKNVTEQIFTLPSKVVNKLNFYSRELGISQSLLVLASIVLIIEK